MFQPNSNEFQKNDDYGILFYRQNVEEFQTFRHDTFKKKKKIIFVNKFDGQWCIKFFHSINLEILCYNLVIKTNKYSLLQMQHLKKFIPWLI